MFQNTVTVPANGVYRHLRPGKVFVCITATAALKVRPDNEAAISIATGRGFGGPAADERHLLTFENSSGVAIDVTFYWGFEDYKPDPSQVSTNVSVNQQNSATTSQAHGTPAAQPETLLTNTELAFADALGKRKQIMVTNRNKPVANPNADDPDVLWVLGADGKCLGEIYPQTSYTFETAGTVTVRNPSIAQGGNGNTVAYMVGEVYYT
jgi:hypothetical protein